MRSYAFGIVLVVLLSNYALGDDGLLGGVHNADVNDEGVIEAAEFAHNEMQKRSNSLYRTRLVQIIDAKTQVVEGIKYILTIEIGDTKCRTGSNTNINDCPVSSSSKCKVVVISQPWLTPPMFLEDDAINCVKENNVNSVDHGAGRSKRHLVGGSMEAEVTSPAVQEAAAFAAVQLNDAANGIYTVKLSQVKSATTQIVAGILVKAQILLKLTSCSDQSTPVNQCNKNSYRYETFDCSVTVWDQAWRTPRYILQQHECGMLLDDEVEQEKPDTALRFVKNGGFHSDNMIGVGHHDGENVVGAKPRIGHSVSDFQRFKAEFSRVYKNDEEEQKRYEQFRANMRRAQFIQDHDLGDAVYGATRFADYTPEEFQEFVSKTWNKNPDSRMMQAEIPNVDPPKEFDWRTKNAVTPVKNQGSCGSCWAFCVTGNIEGQWAIKKSQLLNISEQQLVDCDKIDEGCNGGLPSNAYEEIKRMGGLESEEDYPYTGRDDKCSFSTDKIKVYINGSVNISSNEAEMAQWLYQNGPMAIGINAMAMQFYFGGVSHPWKILCPDALNHGVLIVGYGIKHRSFLGDQPYWIIKNSWGHGWGEKGYYLVYRGDGTCGLNEMVSSAVIN